MADTPQYTTVANVSSATISAANPHMDGTGSKETVFTAGVNGSRIDKIVIKATGQTTAGMVRLFIYNGIDSSLFYEVDIEAKTPSGTVTSAGDVLTEDNPVMPIILPNGYSLLASTERSESFVVTAFGGDF